MIVRLYRVVLDYEAAFPEREAIGAEFLERTHRAPGVRHAECISGCPAAYPALMVDCETEQAARRVERTAIAIVRKHAGRVLV